MICGLLAARRAPVTIFSWKTWSSSTAPWSPALTDLPGGYRTCCVLHKEQQRYGTVTDTGLVNHNGLKAPVIRVQVDDGFSALVLPANKFTNLTQGTVK
jgi:hypothetical protein